MPHSCEDACSKILAKPAVKISRHQIKKLVELDKRAFRARVRAEQRRAKIIVARGATPSPPPSPPSPPSPPPSAPSPSTLLSPSGKKVSTLTHAHAHARASSLPLLLKVGTLTHIIARNAPPHHEEAAISEAISGALARPETLALTLTLSNVSATTHPTGTLPSSLSGVSSDTMVRSSRSNPVPFAPSPHTSSRSSRTASLGTTWGIGRDRSLDLRRAAHHDPYQNPHSYPKSNPASKFISRPPAYHRIRRIVALAALRHVVADAARALRSANLGRRLRCDLGIDLRRDLRRAAHPNPNPNPHVCPTPNPNPESSPAKLVSCI